MRPNPHGVRYLKLTRRNNRPVFHWLPPHRLRVAGLFRQVTLGSDFEEAIAKATDLNNRVDAYRHRINPPKPVLGPVKPMTVGDLIRQFEASPRFAQYAARTQQEYGWFYRNMETQRYDGKKMLGDMKARKITRQFAYSIYEQCVRKHGLESAKKMTSALRAAFKYGTLKMPGLNANPISGLGIRNLPPRRQRWTDDQLTAFIKKADEMGFPSIGRCALMCMELVQRPGDMLSLRWGALREHDGVWYIHQSKRGVEVWVPPTRRLTRALNSARREAQRKARTRNIAADLICPTVTGKRWNRRNFTYAARQIARAAGIPDDLQLRDLRRTAATEGASAGATPSELMAVGGWQSFATIRPYLVHTSEQAAAFQAKREAYRVHRRVGSR